MFVKHILNARLGVWEIIEPAEELLGQVRLCPEERVFYRGLKSLSRRQQWLSYRLILPHLLEANAVSGILYDDGGKPRLENGAGHVSATHSGKYAALIFSKTNRVGVDVELIQPKIVKLTHKFLTPAELEYRFSAHTLESLYVIWSAKEALYKLHGGCGLVFSQHIHINHFTFTGSGQVTGRVVRGDETITYTLFYESLDDYILVYAVEQ